MITDVSSPGKAIGEQYKTTGIAQASINFKIIFLSLHFYTLYRPEIQFSDAGGWGGAVKTSIFRGKVSKQRDGHRSRKCVRWGNGTVVRH